MKHARDLRRLDADERAACVALRRALVERREVYRMHPIPIREMPHPIAIRLHDEAERRVRDARNALDRFLLGGELT